MLFVSTGSTWHAGLAAGNCSSSDALSISTIVSSTSGGQLLLLDCEDDEEEEEEELEDDEELLEILLEELLLLDELLLELVEQLLSSFCCSIGSGSSVDPASVLLLSISSRREILSLGITFECS